MEIQILSYIVEGLLVIFAAYLYRYLKTMPHNGTLDQEQRKLRTDVETSFIELWDYVEGTLAPLRKKITTRVRRMHDAELKEQEALNNQETIKKKGGIIYGLNK